MYKIVRVVFVVVRCRNIKTGFWNQAEELLMFGESHQVEQFKLVLHSREMARRHSSGDYMESCSAAIAACWWIRVVRTHLSKHLSQSSSSAVLALLRNIALLLSPVCCACLCFIDFFADFVDSQAVCAADAYLPPHRTVYVICGIGKGINFAAVQLKLFDLWRKGVVADFEPQDDEGGFRVKL